MSTHNNADRENAAADSHSPDERLLREKAIQEAQLVLPDHAPTRLWTGTGAGHPCALCGKRIGRGEVECQILDRADRVFLFHLRCREVWEDAVLTNSSTSSQRR